MAEKIGFTTSIPVEVILAAGKIPVDMNNIFITSEKPGDLVKMAETYGFPRSFCAWIKGIYGAVLANKIENIIAVTQGDCSNTHVLMEILADGGKQVIPFSFPINPYKGESIITKEIEHLAETLGTTLSASEEMKKSIKPIREKLKKLDEMTWQTGQVSGAENSIWQVSASDFNGDVQKFEKDIDLFLEEANGREKKDKINRIGVVGVPSIQPDFYKVIESLDMNIVYNETQRQFAMPYETDSLAAQYLAFTYPYGMSYRLKDIKKEVEERKINGIIHYVQSFCFRQAEDILLRKYIEVPVLTIEGDQPGKTDARTITRLESFKEMIELF